VRPVDERGLEGVADQQAAKPAAIDEQVGVEPRAVVQNDGVDEAVVALHDLSDLALDPLDAAAFGQPAQEAGIERGVELQRIGDVGQGRVLAGWPHELGLVAGQRLQIVGA